MARTDQNTNKVQFFNLEHVKYNDNTKQTEERL